MSGNGGGFSDKYTLGSGDDAMAESDRDVRTGVLWMCRWILLYADRTPSGVRGGDVCGLAMADAVVTDY